MFVFLATALAGTPSIRVMVGGDEVAVHHGEYCSYPKLAGITTRTSGPIEQPTWDGVFDPDGLKRGFSGLVLYRGDFAVGAHPLSAQADVRQPSSTAEEWMKVLGPCRISMMEGASLPEFLRKLSSGARAVVLRSLANEALSSMCDDRARFGLIEDTFKCAVGKCDDFLGRLAEKKKGKKCD